MSLELIYYYDNEGYRTFETMGWCFGHVHINTRCVSTITLDLS